MILLFVLKLLGIASPVSNISIVQLNATLLELTFDHSFSLDESVSVHYYIIELTAINDSSLVINSSSTVITFSLADHCSNYTATITPYNAIGPGENIIESSVISYQGAS